MSSAGGQLSWWRCRSSAPFLFTSPKRRLSFVASNSSRRRCRTGSKRARSRSARSRLRVSLSSLTTPPSTYPQHPRRTALSICIVRSLSRAAAGMSPHNHIRGWLHVHAFFDGRLLRSVEIHQPAEPCLVIQEQPPGGTPLHI